MAFYLIFSLIVMILLMWAYLYKDDVGIEFVLHCFVTFMIFCALCEYGGSPKAIDVYRGKTTLEITYKDSIPVDSVVVFKERR